MAAHCLLGFLALLCYFLLLHSAADEKEFYEECPKSFPCGNLGDIHFPFTNVNSECSLDITGCEDPDAIKEVLLKNQSYEIESIHQKGEFNSISIYDYNSENPLFSRNGRATVIRIMHFYVLNNITFYRCIHKAPENMSFFKNCSAPDYPLDIYYSSEYPITDGNFPSFPSACSVVQHPFGQLPSSTEPCIFFTSFLEIKVNSSEPCLECYVANGSQCSLDMKKKQCVDPNDVERIPPLAPPAKEHNGWYLKKVMIIVSAAAGFGLLIIIIYGFRRKPWCHKQSRFWKEKSRAHQDFEAFLRSFGPLAVRRYSYSEIKKMTNSFKEKLGQEGYGSVFKGKLEDESLVAVKVLSELKGNGEEFINEVASISRTSHVNIVTLLGFCFEQSKKALIYEFMANGSLEKFIYETKNLTADCQLNCEMLYQIAIGVGRGLEYLHRGCNTRIFHFDIKPHNILLDENFCPKISDFGLAKICPRNESVVSMLAARGTIGYIAPELFCRNIGVVSHKSDVYSFGMMVLEMVGGTMNLNVEVDCTSEIYFPYWIYKRQELNQELALRNIMSESDKDKIRKMVLVSLWCIQTNPSDRPTMHRVVEMLEGNVETLQVPPKPFVVEMLEGNVETLQVPPKPFLSSPPESPHTSQSH